MSYATEKRPPVKMIDELAHDHSKLHAYSGSATFNAMSRDFAQARSQNEFPEFLRETSPYKHSPEIYELARLELALKKALEAPDGPVFTLEELAALDRRAVAGAVLQFHPSVQRLNFTTNATSIWCALHCEQSPASPQIYREPQQCVVWRQARAARFRILGPDEAALLDRAMGGAPFQSLEKAGQAMEFNNVDCQSIDTYFKGWVEAEFIAAVRLMKDFVEK